jgi:putative ABC transport system permease protein
MFSSHVSNAVQALRANGLRSLLTMLGIIIGVAAVISVMAVGAGAQSRVIEEMSTLGANLLLIKPGSAERAGARLGSGTRPTLTEDDARAIRTDVSSVLIVAPFVYARAQAVRGNRNWSTRVQGITADYLGAREWGLEAGRGFALEEAQRAAKVAILGATVADRLFEGIDPLGQVLRVADVPFTVIGLLARKGETSTGGDQDDRIMIPLSTAKIRVLGSSRRRLRSIDYLLVKVGDLSRMDEAQREIAGLLRQRHRLLQDEPDDFAITDLTELQASREAAAGVLGFWLAAVASVSLLVGGVSIMNIMLVSVSERTREIGVRLAVGARRRDIRNQFMVEAVILSLLGAIMGTALGIGAALLLGELGDLRVEVRPEAILLAAGLAVAVGIFFGLYPASRAARMDPINALRFE